MRHQLFKPDPGRRVHRVLSSVPGTLMVDEGFARGVAAELEACKSRFQEAQCARLKSPGSPGAESKGNLDCRQELGI